MDTPEALEQWQVDDRNFPAFECTRPLNRIVYDLWLWPVIGVPEKGAAYLIELRYPFGSHESCNQ